MFVIVNLYIWKLVFTKNVMVMTAEEKYEEAVEELVSERIEEIRDLFETAKKDYEDAYNVDDLEDYIDDYIESNNYERWYDMSDFDELMSGNTPFEIAQKIQGGEFDVNDNYFSFDGYGNLVSNTDGAKEDLDESNFLDWCRMNGYVDWSDYFTYADYLSPDDELTEDIVKEILDYDGDMPDLDDFEDDEE